MCDTWFIECWKLATFTSWQFSRIHFLFYFIIKQCTIIICTERVSFKWYFYRLRHFSFLKPSLKSVNKRMFHYFLNFYSFLWIYLKNTLKKINHLLITFGKHLTESLLLCNSHWFHNRPWSLTSDEIELLSCWLSSNFKNLLELRDRRCSLKDWSA